MSAPCKPRKAPIIATIFTSPKPSPSRWRSFSYKNPTSHNVPPQNRAANNDSAMDTSLGLSTRMSSIRTMPKLNGTKAANITPAAAPPSVNSSGKMRSSRSEKTNVIMMAEKRQNFMAAAVGPSIQTAQKNDTPVNSSTSG